MHIDIRLSGQGLDALVTVTDSRGVRRFALFCASNGILSRNCVSFETDCPDFDIAVSLRAADFAASVNDFIGGAGAWRHRIASMAVGALASAASETMLFIDCRYSITGAHDGCLIDISGETYEPKNRDKYDILDLYPITYAFPYIDLPPADADSCSAVEFIPSNRRQYRRISRRMMLIHEPLTYPINALRLRYMTSDRCIERQFSRFFSLASDRRREALNK